MKICFLNAVLIKLTEIYNKISHYLHFEGVI